jgi:hypothetical protein
VSTELERRLEGMLDELPEPKPAVGEGALARALAALRPVGVHRRGLRTAGLVFAAAVVLLVIAAGSLAAAGALHVRFGGTATHHRVTAQLSLPHGANGIAAIVNGQLSVTIRGGFRLQGLPATAAALSPHARFVAAGIGESLVALAPGGRRPWSHRVGGRVVAIAWAPDGLRIAYVIRSSRHHLALHVIYGNGERDSTIDRSVRSVQPSWRADSLAVAYVGAGGKAIVYDLAHSSRHVIDRSPVDVSQLAFAPTGNQLAWRSAGRVGVGALGRTQLLPRGRFPVTGIGWLGPNLLAESEGKYVVLESVGILPAFRPIRMAAHVVELTADGRMFVAVLAGSSPRIVAGTKAQLVTALTLPRHTAVGHVELR